MKMVKSLLLGSAAGLVAATGVQAADLPVKAKPVEYVKVCSLYGAAYYYVPGTNTCFKIGYNLRLQIANEGSASSRIYRSGGDARYTKEDTAFTSLRMTSQFFFDWRTQTDWGTLRVYTTPQVEMQNPDSAETVSIDRAYMQFAGFTMGIASSALDLLSYSQFAGMSSDQGNSSSSNGMYALRYTLEFGNGLSSSFGFEDNCLNAHGANGCDQNGRKKSIINVGSAVAGVATVTTFNSGGTATIDNGPGQWPDIVANLRLDQAWGTIQVAGVIKQENAGYWIKNPIGAGANCSHTTTCGAPADKWGYGANIQMLFKDVFGFKGDVLGLGFLWGVGLTDESNKASRAWSAFSSDSTQALAPGNIDSIYGDPGSALGPVGYDGSLQLTNVWSVIAGYNHRWNDNWQTSIYGGWGVTRFNDTAKTLICNSFATGGLSGGSTVAGTFNCGDGPNYAAGEIGSRIKWIPMNYLEFQLDVQYHKISTAFKNGFVSYTTVQGGRPSGRYNFQDSDKVIVSIRADYKFFD